MQKQHYDVKTILNSTMKTRGTFNQHGYSDNSSESSVFLSMTFKWYNINFL